MAVSLRMFWIRMDSVWSTCAQTVQAHQEISQHEHPAPRAECGTSSFVPVTGLAIRSNSSAVAGDAQGAMQPLPLCCQAEQPRSRACAEDPDWQ